MEGAGSSPPPAAPNTPRLPTHHAPAHPPTSHTHPLKGILVGGSLLRLPDTRAIHTDTPPHPRTPRLIPPPPPQKGILIGAGGSMLRRIGGAARKEIETFLGRGVYLELSVQVRGWRGGGRGEGSVCVCVCVWHACRGLGGRREGRGVYLELGVQVRVLWGGVVDTSPD